MLYCNVYYIILYCAHHHFHWIELTKLSSNTIKTTHSLTHNKCIQTVRLREIREKIMEISEQFTADPGFVSPSRTFVRQVIYCFVVYLCLFVCVICIFCLFVCLCILLYYVVCVVVLFCIIVFCVLCCCYCCCCFILYYCVLCFVLYFVFFCLFVCLCILLYYVVCVVVLCFVLCFVL